MYVYICEIAEITKSLAEIAKSLALLNVFAPYLSVMWNPICPVSSYIPLLDMPNRSKMVPGADLTVYLLKTHIYGVIEVRYKGF